MTYFINYDHCDSMIWIFSPSKELETKVRANPGSHHLMTEYPHEFRCRGGDGEVYFSGRNTEQNFAPLDDFAEPLGVITIEYRDEYNEWQIL